MRFSQRIGKTPAAKLVQREAVDNELRNSLWSVITLTVLESYRSPGDSMYGRSDYVRGSNLEYLIVPMWLQYFKKPVDTIDEYWEYCAKRLRDYYFKAPWFEVFDFVEFIADNIKETQKEAFTKSCNTFLERESSAYRFVDGKIAEITSQEEIEEVEDAVSRSTPFAGVRTHLESALALMSSRTNPDYRNSIKESISAVESLAKQLSGDKDGTLGVVLKALEKKQALHPALKNAFSSLYGYSNDSNGIRHALMDDSNLRQSDARFMLICCSAFVNYAIAAIASNDA